VRGRRAGGLARGCPRWHSSLTVTDTRRSTSLDGAHILVTGGAGFVGSHIAAGLAGVSGVRVTALDNLKRRGSELKLEPLNAAGVTFVHGDVRIADDLALNGAPVDVIVDCAAEPSVFAGRSGSPRYVLDSNLGGTLNCLELARQRGARVVFLSTSRVYPIAALNALAVDENESRFVLRDAQPMPGASGAGVAESFPLGGARSLYGATKLASELMIEEYAAAYGCEATVLRLGVIAGPGQMGKAEQGVFCHWMARHVFGGELAYHGWGGAGKQVRDLVHVDDVVALVIGALNSWNSVRGRTLNAGGGLANSLSLCETTALCAEITGTNVSLGSVAATDKSDVRVYVTDHAALTAATGWRPKKDPRAVLSDIFEWLRSDAARLRAHFTA